MELTLGSLFDGIGGWCLAAEHTGIRPVWSSEIEKFPLAVTRIRFPYVKQLGDVTKIDATKIEPVDIICAGSPCQDLSIAGKRGGLAGERSGLFRTAISIVHRMRMYTGGRQPRFFIWENVPGAFSSNKGLDFRSVLEEIGQTEIPMPANGKWAENGVAQLPGCEIAWRVLDAQWWVPQRRKRIFLVADFDPGKPCAKEILFVEKSLRGNFEKGQCPGQEVAGSVTDGPGTPIVLRMRGGCDGGGKGALLSENRSLTLAANTNDQVVFDLNTGTERKESKCLDVSFRQCLGHQNAQVVYSFDSLSSNSMKSSNPNSGCRQVQIAKTLDTTTQDPSKNQGGVAVAFCIAGNMVDRETHQHGLGVSENVSSTLTSADRHAVAYDIYSMGQDERETQFLKNEANPLTACDYKQPPIISAIAVDVRNFREQSVNGTLQAKPNGGQSLNLNNVVRDHYFVRRLTPLECERLQGLPDGYTLIDDKSCSDSARYKALGNGMAQPCADFVLRRLVEEVKRRCNCVKSGKYGQEDY